MVNRISKMRRTNRKIYNLLVKLGYTNIHFFPHLRYVKGVKFGKIEFDGIATKEDEKKLVLFQAKTNIRPSKKLIEKYKELSEEYGIECLFISRFDRQGIEIYK